MTSPEGSTRFLKRVALDRSQLGEDLASEAARLTWLGACGLPVPEVIAYEIGDGAEHLLLSAIAGRDAAHSGEPALLPAVVDALAAGLRQLHATPSARCPFNHDRASRLALAERRLLHGVVEGDASADRLAGLHVLSASLPAEDLVVTHGDYCLPNVILSVDPPDAGPVFSGYVDCARAGLADRYQDLALVMRSLARNLGPGWTARFAEAYGLDALDEPRLAFYTMLDDFF